MSKITALKKITIKDVCGVERGEDVKEFMRQEAERGGELIAIAGEVTGYGGKATQFGESFFLIGLFVAQNRKTGEVFKSSKVYLPKDVTENIMSAFISRKTDEQSVKFQLSVSVVKDKSSAVGYAYLCEPIRTPEAVSREQELLASFDALPALPAPSANGKKKTA